MERRKFLANLGLGGLVLATTPIPAFAVGPDGECVDPLDIYGFPYDDNGMLDIKLWAALMGGGALAAGGIVGYALAAMIAAMAVPDPAEPIEAGAAVMLSALFLTLGAMVGMFGYIEDDPPRIAYQTQAQMAVIDVSALAAAAGLGARGLAQLQALVDEVALLGAFLDAMELYQGAELAGDQKWMDIHKADGLALTALYTQNADKVTDACRYVCAYLRQAIDPSIMHNTLPADLDGLWKEPLVASTLAELDPVLQPILDPGGRKFDYTKVDSPPATMTLRQAVNELDEIAKQFCAQRQGQIGCTA
jgi:hypothetical protein